MIIIIFANMSRRKKKKESDGHSEYNQDVLEIWFDNLIHLQL